MCTYEWLESVVCVCVWWEKREERGSEASLCLLIRESVAHLPSQPGCAGERDLLESASLLGDIHSFCQGEVIFVELYIGPFMRMEIRFFRIKNSLRINILFLQLWTKRELWLKCSPSHHSYTPECFVVCPHQTLLLVCIGLRRAFQVMLKKTWNESTRSLWVVGSNITLLPSLACAFLVHRWSSCTGRQGQVPAGEV